MDTFEAAVKLTKAGISSRQLWVPRNNEQGDALLLDDLAAHWVRAIASTKAELDSQFPESEE